MDTLYLDVAPEYMSLACSMIPPSLNLSHILTATVRNNTDDTGRNVHKGTVQMPVMNQTHILRSFLVTCISFHTFFL